MCLKVMNFENPILWLVENFKLNFSIRNERFGWEMKKCHHWKFIFFSFAQSSKFQVFGILNWADVLHLWFKKLLVNRRHAYQSHEKKLFQKELQWMSNGWSKLIIQEKFKQKHLLSSFLGQTNILNSLWMALHTLIQLLFAKICWKHLP
jgi:hypothetical protein